MQKKCISAGLLVDLRYTIFIFNCCYSYCLTNQVLKQTLNIIIKV